MSDNDIILLSKAADSLGPQFKRIFADYAESFFFLFQKILIMISSNWDVFRDAAEGEETHKFEYTRLHNDYINLFESKLQSSILELS